MIGYNLPGDAGSPARSVWTPRRTQVLLGVRDWGRTGAGATLAVNVVGEGASAISEGRSAFELQ